MYKTGKHAGFVVSDRNRHMNIDETYLNSYMKLLIKVCHKRGAQALAGSMGSPTLEGVHQGVSFKYDNVS